MVKSLVIEGEASESEEESVSKAIPPSAAKESPSTVPKSASDELLQQIQEDITTSMVTVITETQQVAVDELSQAAEVLLNTQVMVQKADKALQSAVSSTRSVNTRLDDILSLNFLPQLYFDPQLPSQGVERR